MTYRSIYGALMNSNTEANYSLINNAESLARLTDALLGVRRVGLDTEADSLHHYFEKVCLIQLSFSGTNYIIDPLAGFSLSGFLEVLAQKELVLQGADYDLRMLKRSYEFRPLAPVFDTMLAAQALGYEKIGLAVLVERSCGVLLSKEGQKADWSRRPLSEKLLRYASDDTKYLEAVADAMTVDLRRLGRENWHRECCERVVASAGLSVKGDTSEAWRIKGSSKLPPQTMAYVQELWKWRDQEARQRDRPPFMILHNEAMIELAEWRVKNPGLPLHDGPVFLKRMNGEKFTRIENAIRVAENLSPSEWPVPPERIRERGQSFSPEKVEKLLAACKVIAAELKIEACFLISRATATAVVRHQARSIAQMMELAGMMRWQAELVLPAVQTVLGG